MLFRAREITHPEVGRELLDSFFGVLEDISDIDRPPRMEGRFMSMILDPSKKLARATAEAADPEPATAEAT